MSSRRKLKDSEDPFLGDSTRKQHDFKSLRLCRQIREELQTGLSGEFGDEILQEVWLESVEPAEDASRMIVTVSLPPAINPVEALARLERARGRLRAMVGSAIRRKKVPDLVFRPKGPSAELV